MKRFRNILLLLVIMILGVSLFSCGGKSNDSSTNNNNNNNGEGNGNNQNQPIAELKFFKFYSEEAGVEYIEVSIDTKDLKEATIKYGENYFVADITNIVGYEFEGAYSSPNGGGMQFFDENGLLLSGLILSDDTAIYPVFRIKDYTLRFVNGDDVKETTFTYGQVYEKFDIVHKDGYSFEGWYNGENRVTNEYGYLLSNYQGITEKGYKFENDAVTLEARYNINVYNVIFDYSGYEQNKTIKAEHGSKLTELPNVGKEYVENNRGVELLGWSKTPGSTEFYNLDELVRDDFTLYAVFKTFKDYSLVADGEVIGTYRSYVGDSVKLSDVTMSIPNGYRLVDAYTSESMAGSTKVTQINYYLDTTTLYIKLEAIDYSIEYVLAEDETIIETEYPTQFNCETEVVLPTVSKEHCVFLGWSKTEDGTPYQIGTSIRLNEFDSVKLYPIFKGENVLLHVYDSDNEAEVKDVYSEYGKKVSLTVPVDNNYKFAGYYYIDDENKEVQFTDENGLGINKLDKMELTIKARWNKKLYITTSTEPEGLTEIQTNDFYVKGEQAQIKVNVPEFYKFVGWKEKDNSGSLGEKLSDNLVYKFVLSERDYNLVAVFEPEVYTVTLKVESGVICTKESVEISYNETFVLPIAAKEGYLFEGWYLGETKITDGDGNGLEPWKSGKVTLNAKLKESNDGYILIRNADELTRIKTDNNKKYYLTDDITVSGWEPANFSGTLNGGGFEISGLTKSLFNELSGNVMNLKLEVNIESTSTETTNIGGLANILKNGTISNTEISGSIVIGGSNVGGFVGKREGGSIKDSINNVSVKGSSNNVGGFIGYATGSGLSIINSINNADITGKNYTGGFVGLDESLVPTLSYLTNNGNIIGENETGGIIGREKRDANDGNNREFKPNNLTNNGNIIGKEGVGGIFGYTDQGNGYKSNWTRTLADKLNNNGNVKGDSKVGGLIGATYHDVNNYGILSNSKSSGLIEGGYRVGGLIGYHAQDGASLDINGCSNEGTRIRVTSYLEDNSNFYAEVGGIAGTAGYIYNTINYADIDYAEKGMYVGGIAGRMFGHIQKSTNYGNINASNASYVGGLVGSSNTSNQGGTIKYSDLTNAGNVTGKNYVGGIAGHVYQVRATYNVNYTCSLEKLTNNGKVIGENCTAGVIGYLKQENTDHSYYVQIKAVSIINKADVKGTQNVGGIFGYVFEDPHIGGEILDSSSKGNIEALYKVGGLIGWIDNNLDIKNCSNTGSTIKATSYLEENSNFSAYLGGYVGRGAFIYNCINEANITYTEKGRFVGGIAGYATGQVQNSSNSGIINASNASYVGGLVGCASSSNGSLTHSSLINSGDITGKEYTGGIYGYLNNTISVYNANYICSLKNLENTGTIIGTNCVAGIIGYIKQENTDHSYYIQIKAIELSNKADISGTRNVGGIFGYVFEDPHASGEILDSSSKGNIEAQYKVGGLIGWIDNTLDIKNCSNAGSTIKATSYLDDNSNFSAYLGGYVGRGAYIYNCINEANISYAEKGRFVGGIAGYATGHIQNCSNSGAINAPNASYVGGIVGNVSSSSGSSTHSSLTNSGDITGKEYTGGIYGYLNNTVSVYNTNYTCTLKNLENTGAIIGTNYVAGIIGYIKQENTDHSYYTQIKAVSLINKADVEGVQNVGGLFGYIFEDPHASGEILDSSSKGNIVAQYKVGGLVGWIENGMNIKNCTNEGSTVTATSYYTDTDSKYKVFLGGYVGRGGYFYDCTNDVEIIYEQKGNYVGGLAGQASSYMINCINNAEISAPKSSYVGGLVGIINSGVGNETFENLKNTGSVKGQEYTGGIYGYLINTVSVYNANYTCNLKNLENTGKIIGTNCVAGIIGYIKQENTDHSYWTQIKGVKLFNEADIEGVQNVGGLFGYIFEDPHQTGEILDSSSKGNIKAEYKVGGLIGWIDNGMNIKNCSNAFSTVTATSYYTDTDSSYRVYLGGYTGRGGYFYDCVNDLDIIYDQKGNYVGGFTGQAFTYSINCINNGEINAPKSNYVGGIAGYINSGVGNETFEKLKNTGNVTGKNYTAGIFGYLQNSISSYGSNYTCNLKNLENSGLITGENYTAGLIGYIKQENTDHSYWVQIKVLDSKNTGNISGNDYVAGLFGYIFEDPHQAGEIRDCTVQGQIVYKSGNVDAFAGKIDNTINIVGDDTINEAILIDFATL